MYYKLPIALANRASIKIPEISRVNNLSTTDYKLPIALETVPTSPTKTTKDIESIDTTVLNERHIPPARTTRIP